MENKGWLLLAVGLILASCGPTYYLKKAERAIEQAKKRGAGIKHDTITFHFKSPEIKFNTTLKPAWVNGAPIPLARDTLIVKDKKTGATIKAKINQATNCPDSCNRIQTIFLQADCPPQDLTAEVPCDTVQVGYTLWDIVILWIAMIPGGWLIMTFVIVPLVKRGRR
jgi:hypothetical protein